MPAPAPPSRDQARPAGSPVPTTTSFSPPRWITRCSLTSTVSGSRSSLRLTSSHPAYTSWLPGTTNTPQRGGEPAERVAVQLYVGREVVDLVAGHGDQIRLSGLDRGRDPSQECARGLRPHMQIRDLRDPQPVELVRQRRVRGFPASAPPVVGCPRSPRSQPPARRWPQFRWQCVPPWPPRRTAAPAAARPARPLPEAAPRAARTRTGAPPRGETAGARVAAAADSLHECQHRCHGRNDQCGHNPSSIGQHRREEASHDQPARRHPQQPEQQDAAERGASLLAFGARGMSRERRSYYLPRQRWPLCRSSGFFVSEDHACRLLGVFYPVGRRRAQSYRRTPFVWTPAECPTFPPSAGARGASVDPVPLQLVVQRSHADPQALRGETGDSRRHRPAPVGWRRARSLPWSGQRRRSRIRSRPQPDKAAPGPRRAAAWPEAPASIRRSRPERACRHPRAPADRAGPLWHR